MSTGVQHSAEFRSRYDDLIAGLRLEGVRLSAGEIFAPREFDAEEHAGLQATVATSTGYRVSEGRLTAWMTLAFEGTRGGGEETLVRVRATVEVGYAVETTMTDELFEVFSQRNLPLNTWPYLREFVQNSLSRAGWPVYTLPAFKPAALQLQLGLAAGSPEEK
jgi:hypothetical protein